MRRQLYVSALFLILNLFFLVDAELAQQGQGKGYDLKIEIEKKYLDKEGFKYGLQEIKNQSKEVGKIDFKAYRLVYKIASELKYFYDLKDGNPPYEISTRQLSDRHSNIAINVGFVGVSLETAGHKDGLYLVDLGGKNTTKTVRSIFKSLATISDFKQKSPDVKKIKFIAINIEANGNLTARQLTYYPDPHSRLLFVLWDTTEVDEEEFSNKLNLKSKSQIIPLMAEELAEEKSITEKPKDDSQGTSASNPEKSSPTRGTFFIKYDYQNEMNFEAIKQDLEAHFQPAIEVNQKQDGKIEAKTKDEISPESQFVLKESQYFNDANFVFADRQELTLQNEIPHIPVRLKQTDSRRAGENDPEIFLIFEHLKSQLECVDKFGKSTKLKIFHEDSVYLPRYWVAHTTTLRPEEIKLLELNPDILKIDFDIPKKEVKFGLKGLARGESHFNSDDVKLRFSGQNIHLSSAGDTLLTGMLFVHSAIKYELTVKNRFYEEIDKELTNNDYQNGFFPISLKPRNVSILVTVKEAATNQQKIKCFRFKGENEVHEFNKPISLPMPDLPKQIELCEADQNSWKIVAPTAVISDHAADTKSHTVLIKRAITKRDFALKLDASQVESLKRLDIQCQIHPYDGDKFTKDLQLDANQTNASIFETLDWPVVPMTDDKVTIQIDKPSGYDIVEKSVNPSKPSNWQEPRFTREFALPYTLNLELKKLPPRAAFFVDITEVSLNRNSMREAILEELKNEANKNDAYIFISNGQERAYGTGAEAKNVLQKMFLLNMLVPSFYQELNAFREEIKRWEGNTKRRPLVVHFFISSKTYEWIQVDLKLLKERLKSFEQIDNEKDFYFYVDGTVVQQPNGFGEYEVIQVKNGQPISLKINSGRR